MKPVNQKAWLLILPVVLCVAFSAVLPLMTVVNYSVQDIFSPERRVFVGTEWFKAVMRDDDLQGALLRQISFSLAVLAVEIPLGIALALAMPAKGWQSSAVLVTVAISLLIPWNVVGTIWQIYGRADIGLMGATLAALGIDYSYTGNATHAWLTVLLMDVWHWTPLVALLCFAGLRAIPDAYYQAASIDGASKFAVFRYIQLPKLRGVLVIAVLLRFMDSFMIYTEPFVLTGGGPGNATTFLSQYLTQKAVGQFDLGPAAAFSLIYFLIILVLSFILYNWMQRVGTADKASGGPAMDERRFKKRVVFLIAYLVFAILPVYWMVNMSFKTNDEILSVFSLWPRDFTLEHYRTILTDESWYSGYINSMIYVAMNTVMSLTVALPAAYAFSPLPLPRRQACVLLAADQPHDAAGGVPAAVLPALHHAGPDGHPHRRGAGAPAVQRAAGGVDPRRLHERHPARDRRDRLHRRLQLPALLRHDLHPADQGRRRRGSVLLLHVQLGRTADGAHADQRERQAHRRDDDAHRQCLRHGLGRAGRGRCADHRARRHRHLVRAPLHRQGLRHGPGLRSR